MHGTEVGVDLSTSGKGELMAIEYTVIEDDPRWMAHKAKRLGYETECDGCGNRFGTETQDESNPRVWHVVGNRFVTVITDRSGSEYATVHLGDTDCLGLAIAVIDEWEG